ncbi:LEAF RUST 10 DISEASE-RESISTANCE LOCUS RECEPTOR-LIKE PROTEIN KINASE-like 2.5 [Hevea brasiliensis]|uniref:LEAF RUST 10 DISEASE-RESISTANCE LOCUS RECEPTOR-LIKE PROTEIN KINASE-like 2.5 n=1 Tax=Hevea brasiliensis TaxID=3981 RepID=UPI0025D736C1|nr:LEAF RUST 10 DISEASE-RESISTANCE LOCUS RECEPTOR-LIKE PROTEIN KINASE-like 2.5 [Hevea brasiliensis]
MAPKRYSYSDVKKMTDSFKTRLGQGGYGTVYKGSLLDGRPVAVKILNNSLKVKGMGEEFINEVASITKTSNVNIVSLLGFCFEGDKRALIYEFMANDSLEKFIYNGNTWKVGCCLQWENFYEVGIGIAKGLEHLHGGCNTRILHLDIKPHNILLDENFHPKIADFGLSKLCSRKESITSMDDARGTIGYIAPEVYSRRFGRVSHKSDVYSHGMLILEIVSGRNNANIRTDYASVKFGRVLQVTYIFHIGSITVSDLKMTWDYIPSKPKRKTKLQEDCYWWACSAYRQTLPIDHP